MTETAKMVCGSILFKSVYKKPERAEKEVILIYLFYTQIFLLLWDNMNAKLTVK